MAVQIPEGYAQVTIPLQHSSLARPAAITFGIDNNTGGFFTPALADTIMGTFASNINMDSNVTIGPAVLRISDGAGGTGTISGSVSQPGSQVGTVTPPQIATLCRKSTARLGRRGRGRMFIPWWTADDNVDEVGVITPATVTSHNTRLADWLADLSTAQTPMVLLHDGDGVTPAPSPDVVTAMTVDPRVGTQRRRLRG